LTDTLKEQCIESGIDNPIQFYRPKGYQQQSIFLNSRQYFISLYPIYYG